MGCGGNCGSACCDKGLDMIRGVSGVRGLGAVVQPQYVSAAYQECLGRQIGYGLQPNAAVTYCQGQIPANGGGATPYSLCMNQGPCDPMACDYSQCPGMIGDPSNFKIFGYEISQSTAILGGAVAAFMVYKMFM